jgi:hypothetical protein
MLAKIYRPAKNAMQSGKAATKKWRLEFVLAAAPRPDALMGWISGADPNGQVRMTFDTKEAAIEFAREHAIPHQVAEAPKKRSARSDRLQRQFRLQAPRALVALSPLGARANREPRGNDPVAQLDRAAAF